MGVRTIRSHPCAAQLFELAAKELAAKDLGQRLHSQAQQLFTDAGSPMLKTRSAITFVGIAGACA